MMELALKCAAVAALVACLVWAWNAPDEDDDASAW